MSEMIEVVIDSIRVSLMSQQRIVILREKNNERYLPIWIGIYEAESITIALQEVEVARPLTHDLMKNIFFELNARIIRVEVVALRDDTYYGNIIVEAEGRTIKIDSRPSDALAIAVRAHVPILVARSVMDVAGITPEEDIQEEAPEAPRPAAPSEPPSPRRDEPEAESGDDRLDVFKDFLAGLDLDNLDNPPGGEDRD
jgi:bifunctional DNase/RNase